MTPPPRLAEIAREVREQKDWRLETVYDYAAAVTLQYMKEMTERVCPACGKSEPGNDGLCPDPRQLLIYRHEYERREGRT